MSNTDKITFTFQGENVTNPQKHEVSKSELLSGYFHSVMCFVANREYNFKLDESGNLVDREGNIFEIKDGGVVEIHVVNVPTKNYGIY